MHMPVCAADGLKTTDIYRYPSKKGPRLESNHFGHKTGASPTAKWALHLGMRKDMYAGQDMEDGRVVS
jgi:hypothetical protein